ncbi:MAG: hypothetical protein ACK5L5_01665 [Bacteroidales bacterium]
MIGLIDSNDTIEIEKNLNLMLSRNEFSEDIDSVKYMGLLESAENLWEGRRVNVEAYLFYKDNDDYKTKIIKVMNAGHNQKVTLKNNEEYLKHK